LAVFAVSALILKKTWYDRLEDGSPAGGQPDEPRPDEPRPDEPRPDEPRRKPAAST
jgi:hypothetical protein